MVKNNFLYGTIFAFQVSDKFYLSRCQHKNNLIKNQFILKFDQEL